MSAGTAAKRLPGLCSAACFAAAPHGVACGSTGGQRHRARNTECGQTNAGFRTVSVWPRMQAYWAHNHSEFFVSTSVCPYEMGVQQAPTASGCTRQPPVAGQCFPPIPPGQELREPAQCATSVPYVSTVRRAVRRSVWRRSVLFQRRRAAVGAVHPAVGPANPRRRDYLAEGRASRYPLGWRLVDLGCALYYTYRV